MLQATGQNKQGSQQQTGQFSLNTIPSHKLPVWFIKSNFHSADQEKR